MSDLSRYGNIENDRKFKKQSDANKKHKATCSKNRAKRKKKNK